MRGRSLLREPNGHSLCVFCANRLGVARTPSHVQRRFIQSSHASLKPPAESAAVREDDGGRGTIPNAQSGPSRAGLGPTSSWGRGAFGSGIPPARPAVSWGKPGRGSNETSENQIPSPSFQSTPKPYMNDLLPHEQRARDEMLEKHAFSQQRVVNISSGPGPTATRSSRPIPRKFTDRDSEEAARGVVRRQKARAVFDTTDRNRFTSRQRLSRNNVTGDGPPPRFVDTDVEVSKWSQLRKREDRPSEGESGPGDAQNRSIFRDEKFTEGRTKREEQARVARYTPLNGRIEAEGSLYARARPDERSQPTMNRASTNKDDRFRPEAYLRNMDRSPISRFSPGKDRPREQRDVLGSRHFMQEDRQRLPQKALEPEPVVTYSPLGVSPEVKAASEMERTRSALRALREPVEEARAVKEVVEESEEVEERDSRKRQSGRLTERRVYEDVPKGKGRKEDRRRGHFLVDEEEDEGEQAKALAKAELKRKRKEEKAAKKAAAPTPILLPEYISVSNLAVALKVRFNDFVEKMEELGFEERSHDHILNAENAGLIAMEYNFEAIIDKGDSEDLKPRDPAPDPSILPQRPPVVTIMGHVDHGKTTLLDWLRKSSVAATEHGGITQHIGAFSVPMPSGKIITFLDTPGHAAFLSMRQRGANVTDIVILVVAADDSVMPQTIEAIKHAQTAKVPIIVAINKVDKEDSNIDRVKQDLARYGVDVEDYGGDTQVVCVSGKTGQGMDELEQAAVALSEIIDMRAETDGPAEGWVLEASIKSMGKVATVLVRRGTMRPGDFIVAGTTWARIRCLRNEAGVEIEEAGPGTPVEIDGWREQPLAGDEVLQAVDETKAKNVVDYRLEKEERDKMALDMEAINENRKAEQEKREHEKAEAAAAKEALANDEEVVKKVREKNSALKEIFFIVKGDVSGSVEAVIDSISGLGNAEVRPHVLRSGVGQLGEFDVEHASAAKGLLINFNTPVDPSIAQLAAQAKVPILDHNIIYRLVDDVKAELSKHLAPLITHRVLGEAEISEIFKITIKGRQQKPIAGSKVRNGTISKNAKVRVMRWGEKVFDGTLASLKNVKKDVSEMKKGTECGIGFDGWTEFQVGDHVQSYEELSEKRYL